MCLIPRAEHFVRYSKRPCFHSICYGKKQSLAIFSANLGKGNQYQNSKFCMNLLQVSSSTKKNAVANLCICGQGFYYMAICKQSIRFVWHQSVYGDSAVCLCFMCASKWNLQCDTSIWKCLSFVPLTTDAFTISRESCIYFSSELPGHKSVLIFKLSQVVRPYQNCINSGPPSEKQFIQLQCITFRFWFGSPPLSS